ncbi:High mobility group box domain [Pseudocohnilembus persalinus]|uniref:High mobility group box domain n=1 Tax=Pseudocohnilembus persalinus TaxID=266149 RepID=A0A0V0R7B5_PSEPJ|nr:High mobility group box domain [Pseudocohnilembus persalinus]|eukprot:KRX10382.1 High mobility group box domain [Pseudocohnilembus persalinus]
MQLRSYQKPLSDLTIPKREYTSVAHMYAHQQSAKNSNLSYNDAQKQWSNLSDDQKKQYQHEFNKLEEKFLEQLHNFEYQKQGLRPPKYTKPTKSTRPQQPMNITARYIKDNSEQLKKEYDNYKKDKIRHMSFIAFASDKIQNASKSALKKYEEAYEQERKTFYADLEKWKRKYQPEEKKTDRRSRNTSEKSRAKSTESGKKSMGKKSMNKKQ